MAKVKAILTVPAFLLVVYWKLGLVRTVIIGQQDHMMQLHCLTEKSSTPLSTCFWYQIRVSMLENVSFPSSASVSTVDILLHFGHQLPVSLCTQLPHYFSDLLHKIKLQVIVPKYVSQKPFYSSVSHSCFSGRFALHSLAKRKDLKLMTVCFTNSSIEHNTLQFLNSILH